MSSANVELVQSMFAAWERGDWSSAPWAHPEIEFLIAGGPSPCSWTGIAGIAEACHGFLGAWEGYRVEAGEYRELDDERVLVLDREGGRGRISGLEIGHTKAEGASLFHIRDGKVTKLVVHWDRDRALADLGLTQEADA